MKTHYGSYSIVDAKKVWTESRCGKISDNLQMTNNINKVDCKSCLNRD